MADEKFNDSYHIIIEKFLQQFENQQKTKIKNYEIESNVVDEGNNYLSIILRLRMEYLKDGKKCLDSVIVKIPELCQIYEMMNSNSNVFSKELYMYNEVLPKLYKFWKGELFTPFGYTINGTHALVLEDLNYHGYRQKHKLDRLDLQHCIVALRTVAQFHALSIKYKEIYNEDNNIMINTIFPTDNDNSFLNYHKQSYEKFLEAVLRLDSEDTYNKLKSCCKNPWETIFQKKYDPNEFNVLLHGDLWTANIMFWYDDKNCVQKMKIIDWQFCHWGSPIMDLILLFVTSVHYEVIEKYYEFLVQLYVSNLNKILCELECDKKFLYSEGEMWKDLEKHKYHWVSVIGTVFANSMAAIKNLLDENGKPIDIHSSDLYESNLLKWLSFLKNKVQI